MAVSAKEIRKRLRVCTTKRTHKSMKQARREAVRMRNENNIATINAYKCKFCRYYHTGNNHEIKRLLQKFEGQRRQKIESLMHSFLNLFDSYKDE